MSESNYRNLERGMELIPAPAVPRTFLQYGILVLDGSGSMNGQALNNMSKADGVQVAVRDVLERSKASSQRKNFRFAVVSFGSEGRVLMEPTAASDVDDNGNFDPRHPDATDTFIGSGLRVAHCLAEEFLAETGREVPASCVIVVLSDGRDREASGQGPAETLGIAEKIKRNPAITLCAAYFAEKGLSDPEAEDVLRRIASNPVTGYKTVYDAETLRAFFQASLSAGRRI